jgi:hypothetical protein
MTSLRSPRSPGGFCNRRRKPTRSVPSSKRLRRHNFHDFFHEFQGKPFPTDEQLTPLLIRHGIDRKYLADVSTRLRENGIYANVLQQQSGVWRIASNQLLLVFGSEARTGPATAADVDYDKVIFVITSIGKEDSEERQHADLVLRHIIAPVAKVLELKAVRADEIERSGIINRQVFEYLTRRTNGRSYTRRPPARGFQDRSVVIDEHHAPRTIDRRCGHPRAGRFHDRSRLEVDDVARAFRRYEQCLWRAPEAQQQVTRWRKRRPSTRSLRSE